MSSFIIWYNDRPGEDFEDYIIVTADNVKDGWKKAEEIFGDYVISVEPYNP